MKFFFHMYVYFKKSCIIFWAATVWAPVLMDFETNDRKAAEQIALILYQLIAKHTGETVDPHHQFQINDWKSFSVSELHKSVHS